MKAKLMALLVLLTVAVVSAAQVRQGTFNQRGLAVQELRDEGLCAAHPSLPIGSKARITNLANNEDIEVTITRRVQPSIYRIIDLSPGAALMLGFELGQGGPVIVRAINLPPPPDTPAEPEPAKAQSGNAPEAQPYNIIINNYTLKPDQQPPELNAERPTRQHKEQAAGENIPTETVAAAVPVEPSSVPEPQPRIPEPALEPQTPEPAVPEPVVSEPVPAQVPPPPVQPAVEQRAVLPLFNSPPVNNIRIAPRLPDPNSGKVYRLHVGTYSSADQSYRAVQQLQAAGFDVMQEQSGEGRRVYAANVPAARVYYAAQRLGAIGFQQVWVYE